MRRQGRRPTNRAPRRVVGAWAVATALAGAAIAAAPGVAAIAPAGARAGMAGMDVVAGASGAPALSPSDRRPGPGGPGRPPHDPAPVPPPANGAAPAPTVTVTTPAPDQDPRPVTARPGARVPRRAPAAALAVRELAVRSEVPVGLARADGIAIAFVPRPGSLVADVRLYAREGGGRQLVESRLVPAHGGRRTTVRLRVRAARRGAYEVAVRAGAGRRTLGPAVVARVRIR